MAQVQQEVVAPLAGRWLGAALYYYVDFATHKRVAAMTFIGSIYSWRCS